MKKYYSLVVLGVGFLLALGFYLMNIFSEKNKEAGIGSPSLVIENSREDAGSEDIFRVADEDDYLDDFDLEIADEIFKSNLDRLDGDFESFGFSDDTDDSIGEDLSLIINN